MVPDPLLEMLPDGTGGKFCSLVHVVPYQELDVEIGQHDGGASCPVDFTLTTLMNIQWGRLLADAGLLLLPSPVKIEDDNGLEVILNGGPDGGKNKVLLNLN